MTLEAFRQGRSDLKRSAILAAGLALFRQQGFGDTTMEQVARTAQVSTATLYRHFRSKEALFEAVATDGLARLSTTESRTDWPAEARLAELARAYARLLSEPETRSLTRMLIGETNRNPDLAARFYDSIKVRLSDLFAEVVSAGMAECRFRKDDNPAAIAGQLQGMIEHGTLLMGLILGDEVAPGWPVEKIADEALLTWLARWRLTDKA